VSSHAKILGFCGNLLEPIAVFSDCDWMTLHSRYLRLATSLSVWPASFRWQLPPTTIFYWSVWVPCDLTPSRLCLYCSQLAAGATGSSNQRGMLTNLARTIADQSEVSSKFFCHICNACLSSKNSLVTHIKGSHLATSMFQCDQCGASFKWYMQLHRHRRRFHGGDTDHHDNGSGDYQSNEYLPETDPQWR